ncbi:hypothetical protein ACVDFE_34655 [Lentzea chajnantorensis]
MQRHLHEALQTGLHPPAHRARAAVLLPREPVDAFVEEPVLRLVVQSERRENGVADLHRESAHRVRHPLAQFRAHGLRAVRLRDAAHLAQRRTDVHVDSGSLHTAPAAQRAQFFHQLLR